MKRAYTIICRYKNDIAAIAEARDPVFSKTTSDTTTPIIARRSPIQPNFKAGTLPIRSIVNAQIVLPTIVKLAQIPVKTSCITVP